MVEHMPSKHKVVGSIPTTDSNKLRRLQGDDIAHMGISIPLYDRIDNMTSPEPNTGCWLWMGSLCDGYAATSLNRARLSAARVNYERYKCKIPDGMLLRHKCDVPECVNPDHLVVGTNLDNSNDKISRGRFSNGRPWKLSEKDKSDIYRMYKNGASKMSLARMYNVLPYNIAGIVRRRDMRLSLPYTV